MPVFNNILAGAAGSGGAAGYKVERSLRFNKLDNAYLKRTPSSSSNRRTWTWSGWVKLVDMSGGQSFLFGASGGFQIYFANNKIFLDGDASTSSNNYWTLVTEQVFRDPSAWYHLVFVHDTTQTDANDRFKIYVNGVQLTQFDTNNRTNFTVNYQGHVNNNVEHQIGRQPDQSVYANFYLAENHFVDGQALAPTDFGEFDADTGVWNPKKYSGSHGTNGFHLDFSDNSSNAALGTDAAGSNNWTVRNITAFATATGTVSGTGTPANPSGSGGWKQAFDGSTSTLVYNSNGSTTTTFTLDSPIAWSNSIRIYAGQNATSGTNIIANGVNLSSSITWNLTGEWKEVSSALTSPLTSLALTSVGGSSSNIRAVEIDNTVIVQSDAASIDSLIDSPTNYEADSGNNGGNYCVWNPLTISEGSTYDGNLLFYGAASNTPRANGTISASSGKWYYEVTLLNAPSSTRNSGSVYNSIGWGLDSVSNIVSAPNSSAMNHSFYLGDSGFYKNFSGSNTDTGTVFAAGDVIGVAADLDNNTMTFYRNGSSILSQTIGVTAGTRLCPAIQSNSGDYGRMAANFGQRPFAYTPPTGYKSLCTQNLDDPLIADGSDHFDTKLWTGTGSSNSLSGFSFSPDLVWLKSRSHTYDHYLTDTVRGATKSLRSNTTAAEDTLTQGLTAFTSDGFTVGTEGQFNNTGRTMVAWAWDGGDLATNSAYNQSQTWSSATLSSGTLLENLFDANNSTSCQQSTNGVAASITNFGPVSVNSTVSFYSPDGDARYTLNGGSEVSVTGAGWHDISFAGTLTSFTFQAPGSSRIFIYGMKVDGKELVDAGVIPVGSLNSVSYDQSQTWSSTGTVTNADSSYPITNAFDGNLTSFWASSANATSRYTFASVYSGTKFELRLDVSLAATGFSVNGQSSSSVTGAMGIQWVDVTDAVTASNLGGLSYIEISYTPSQYSTSIYGVRIDGKLLVDSGVSVTNAPSIASTVRANPTAGFSIVEWTPTAANGTIGHGLNAAPEFVITKSKTNGSQWFCFHSALGGTKAIALDSTDAAVTTSSRWNNTAPTSSVVHLGDGGTNYYTSDSAIAYCISPVAGFSAVGKYDGNGSSNGPFVYTGFRPRWVMHKRHDAGGANVGDWRIWDTARDIDNAAESILFPNGSNAEATHSAHGLDILSNGFKFRTSDSNINGNGGTYLYIAFAENFFKYARAR